MKLIFLLLPFALMAKPSGMQTISGKATYKETAGEVVIESGKHAIVKWDEFSIGKGERVRFAMPDSKSAIINRVSGARSELLGQLDSNGKVYLLNPKGVLIGKDAVINTASFVASSLDVLDQDFLRGEELLFSGDSKADVVNLGTISCLQGEVVLIAHNVANRGKIEGKFVGIASGPEILLKPEGNQRIFIKAKGGDSVQHSGQIKALVTELRSGSVYDKAISCEGKIEAIASETRNGRIYLVAEHGKNNFDGKIEAKGGTVHILGDQIFLGDHAHVDVSAEGGGGTLLVGGDYRGMDMDLPNALDVIVTNGAFINANAEKQGNGGKVVFWADREMKFFGDISSRGGDEGGDGGFVEVSGNQSLLYRGLCDVRAPFGKLGDLLLDPDTDVSISSGVDSGMNLTLPTFSPTAIAAVLNIDTLVSNLNTANVTVTTSGSASGGGTLTYAASAVPTTPWTNASMLTLDAAIDIDIDAVIANTLGTLVATAGADVNVKTGASISLEGMTLTAATGSVTADTATLTCGSGGITITGTQIAANTAIAVNIETCTLTTSSGDIAITGDASAEGVGAVSIVGIKIKDSIVTSGTGAAGTITLTGEGGNGLDNCYGVHLNGTTITSTNGNITLLGNQNSIPSTAGNAGNGIELDNVASVITLGAATIQFTGTGATSSGGSADGVRIAGASVTSSDTNSTGTITIDGVSGLGSAGSNFGVSIVNISTITSTTGAIAINGNQVVTTPLSPGGSNRGVYINGNGSALIIQSLGTGSTAAPITITGTGVSDGGGGTNNRGVQISGGGVAGGVKVTSIDGSITITGTKGPDTNQAVQTLSGALFETTGTTDTGTTTNNVTITTGAGTSGDINISSSDITVASPQSDISITTPTGGIITIESASEVVKTGLAGTVTISAPEAVRSGEDAVTINSSIISSTDDMKITGSKTSTAGRGVNITGGTAAVTFGTTGTITGTSLDNNGVGIVSGSTFTGGSGLATITGSAVSSAVGSIQGVRINSSTITGGSGDLTVTGGFGTSVANSDLAGIIIASSTVTQSSSGKMTFSGTGGVGTSDNRGLTINGSSALTVSAGTLALNGTGGSDGSSSSNHGVLINDMATITGTLSGVITMSGESGAGTNGDNGVLIQTSGTVVSCADGGINISGESFSFSLSSSRGILVNTGALIETTGSGDLVFNGIGSTAAMDEGQGVTIDGSVAPAPLVTSSGTATGNISITGQGNGIPGSTANYGVFLVDTTLSSANSGRIILDGIGGDGASSLQGVRILDAILTSLDGNISVTGVGGSGAGGSSHGINIFSTGTGGMITSTGTATITCDGTAGSGAATDEGIRMKDSATLVSSTSGMISLTGRASGASTTGIHITDDATVGVALDAAPIALETFSDIIIDEGGSVIGGSGLVTVDSARDLIINGNTSAATPSGIFLGAGDFRGNVARDVTLTGGTVAGTFAQIGANSASSTAAIRFPNIGRNLLIDGEDTDGYALIGHGDPSSTFTYNAPINFSFIGGNATVTGATVAGGGAGFAQIGHAGTTGASLGGDITVRPFGNMNVLGGSAAGTSFARVGHGGHGGAPTFTAATVLLAAGRNLTLQESAGFGAAEIENPSTAANSGRLTLVTDDRNPVPPGFGVAGVNIDGTLTATGELRIYTVDRPLNTIVTPINGEAFTPGTGRVDNPQEQFGIYFPSGSFSTAAFRIYYKIGVGRTSRIDLFNNLLIANAQLQDELPLFRFMRLPNYPFYHPNICEERRRKLLCDPGFDPYGSLNFQDDVYWIGKSAQ